MAVKPNTEPVQDKDAIRQYMEDKFADLIEKVGEGYGQPLQDELFRRLEKTIADFDEDVTELLDDLKQRSEKRYEALKKILVEGEEVSESGEMEPSEEVEAEQEISDWERRLEEKAKGSKVSDLPGDKKKHGRFSLKRR